MVGESRGVLGIGTADRLHSPGQCVREPGVPCPCVLRQHVRLEDLCQQRVREPVGAGRVRREDAEPHRLPQRLRHVHLRNQHVSDFPQEFGPLRPPRDRHQAGQIPGGFREPEP